MEGCYKHEEERGRGSIQIEKFKSSRVLCSKPVKRLLGEDAKTLWVQCERMPSTRGVGAAVVEGSSACLLFCVPRQAPSRMDPAFALSQVCDKTESGNSNLFPGMY